MAPNRSPRRPAFAPLRGCGIRQIRVPANSHQLRGNAFGGSTKSTQPVATAACGMEANSAVAPVLRKCHAARGFDGFDSRRAVRTRAGEDHADGPASALLGQRPQEPVDGHVQSRRLRAGSQSQRPLRDGQIGVRRYHVHVVGLHRHAVGRLADRHGGGSRKDLGQHAVVLGIEMLNEHDGQAGVGGQIGQQMFENFQPARGAGKRRRAIAHELLERDRRFAAHALDIVGDFRRRAASVIAVQVQDLSTVQAGMPAANIHSRAASSGTSTYWMVRPSTWENRSAISACESASGPVMV
jgi:hypothetical protein